MILIATLNGWAPRYLWATLSGSSTDSASLSQNAPERQFIMRKFVALFAALCAFTVLLAGTVTPAAAQDVNITLIHGIPDVDVDVEINGDIAVESFQFGDRQDLTSLAGETLDSLVLFGAGTDADVFDLSDITIPDDGNYTYIAHLDADGEPIVTRFTNDIRPITAGKGRLTVRHTAGVGPVDISLDGGNIIRNLSNAREGGADIEVGDYEIAVHDVDEEDALIGPADISVIEGESIVVYAVGSGDSATVLTEKVVVSNSDAMTDDDDDTGTDDDDGDNDDGTDDDDSGSMTDDDDDGSDTAMNSAPAGVETGNSPISSTTFPIAALALGVIVVSSAGIFGLRRFEATR